MCVCLNREKRTTLTVETFKSFQRNVKKMMTKQVYIKRSICDETV